MHLFTIFTRLQNVQRGWICQRPMHVLQCEYIDEDDSRQRMICQTFLSILMGGSEERAPARFALF